MTQRRVRWWYRGAAIYGVPVLVATGLLGRPVANPETFYGFVGAALCFQLVYWMIGTEPVRYRPLMPVAVLAKLSFFLPCLWLFAAGGLGGTTMAFASVDAVLATGFALAWRAGPRA